MIYAMVSLAACLVLFSRSFAAEAPLRATLEQAWRIYLNACRSGKESELEKAMSASRFQTMKNTLASAGRSLTPDLIKSIAEYAPDISTAKFVRLMEKGPTAGLVYVRDSEETDASNKPRVDFIFIKFVQENDAWKVDEEMNIGSPKFQANGREAEFNPDDIPETHRIDGIVRKPPAQAPAPDVAGLLDVSSYGYTTEITINSAAQEPVANKSYSGIIKEGLKKGSNSIELRFTKTDTPTAFKPGVTIRCASGDITKEVFKYEPKDPIEGAHTFTFTVAE